MADVRPFRGVTYDAERVALDRVLCPPYDVISPRQQRAYEERDPRNFVRVVLNSSQGESRYREAAASLDSWLEDGTLQRDEAPSLYVHRHSFVVPGGARMTRLGLLAAVRLEPWDSGAVRPHEHTMPGPKQDRLELMRATRADTESIWVFHPDPHRELAGALQAISVEAPWLRAEFRAAGALDGEDPAETHELWRVAYPATIERLQVAAGAAPLYIADGHHRYETALHHAQEAGGGPDDATRFKLMMVSPAEDPGLLVLPTHRLVRLAGGQAAGDLPARLAAMGWTSEPFADLEGLLSRLAAAPSMGRLGFGLVSDGQFQWLQGSVLPGDVSSLEPSIAALDVGLLHEGVLRPLLGLGPAELAAGDRVAYSRDAAEVCRRVDAREFDLGILVRAPTLAQVQAVADAHGNMPQKSTYFWPKPASGLLCMLQRPGEPL